jgi:hypothetical protein
MRLINLIGCFLVIFLIIFLIGCEKETPCAVAIKIGECVKDDREGVVCRAWTQSGHRVTVRAPLMDGDVICCADARSCEKPWRASNRMKAPEKLEIDKDLAVKLGIHKEPEPELESMP